MTRSQRKCRSSANGEDSEILPAQHLNDDEDQTPQNVHAMVPWYSFLLFLSSFDILVQFLVFLGRYDARTMQPALARSSCDVKTKRRYLRRRQAREAKRPTATRNEDHRNGDGVGNSTASEGENSDDSGCDPSPGCVFDCEAIYSDDKSNDEENDGMWFDFMADCGDG